MFGFYYAAAGLVFGTLCSISAKGKIPAHEEWFTFGFLFNLPGYLILLLILKKRGNKRLKIDSYPSAEWQFTNT